MVRKPTLTNDEKQRADAITWWHSIPLADDYMTRGHSLNLQQTATTWGVPRSLSGKRVLDVGCWNGGFSFECERRGANVVGIDIWQAGRGLGANLPLYQPDGLMLAREVLQSSMEFVELDAASAADHFGERSFDIVLCFGILYHVNPYQPVVESLCKVAKSIVLVETEYLPNREGPDWVWMPGHNNDPYIYWYPTPRGLQREFGQYGYQHAPLTQGPSRLSCMFRR